MTPNPSEIDTLKRDEIIYGVVPIFNGTASGTVTSLSVDGQEDITLTTGASVRLGNVRMNTSAITVTAKE